MAAPAGGESPHGAWELKQLFPSQVGGHTRSVALLWRLDLRVFGVSMGPFPESGFARELEALLTFPSTLV